MDAETWLRDPATKRTYVAVLFDVIAPGYDAFTRLFSFGMDRHRKRTMIRAAVRGGVHLGAADMRALGIRSARADIVAVAYGLRSAPSAEEALKEAARVLRPGGLLLQRHTTVTEFSHLLTDAGLVLERVYPRLGGAVCIHVARKLTTARSVG